jgi:carbon monoxide dehydrogenase subunit G
MNAARITITERVELAAPPPVVWACVTDPHFVVTCVPGAKVIDEHDGVVEGAIEVRLGPTVVNFLGSAVPDYDHEAHRGRLTARGSDKQGRTKAQANLTFEVQAAEPGHSVVVFDGAIELAGGLAGFLQTGGAHLTRRMMKDFGDQLAGRVEADAAEAAVPAEATPVNGIKLVVLAIWDWLRAVTRRPGSLDRRSRT